jgi:hypothetical protein
MSIRLATLVTLVTVALFATTVGSDALPVAPMSTTNVLTQVQLQCDQFRCIDPRTGAYGQSTCDRFGCRPLTGPTGRLGAPGYGYHEEYRAPRASRGGAGFDCNPQRCIELSTGAVWESTCGYRGCAPLRPARGYRRY